jgi:NAD+ diphosphatase
MHSFFNLDTRFVAELTHTFAGNPLDRGEAIRRSEEEVQALAEDPTTLFLPFHELKVAVRDDGKLAWTTRDDLPEEIRKAPDPVPVFLGVIDNVAHFAYATPADAATEDATSYADCRLIASQLDGWETGILAQARAQLDWHQRNPYCPQCGGATQPERGGQIRRCGTCGKHYFPRTDPVAIMLIIDKPGGDRCLLGKSQGRMAQTNFYSALAGFLDQGESLEEAVRREVWEEAGIRVGDVQYHSSQPWPFPSQLMIGCHGLAETLDIRIDPVEMADVRWFTRAEVAQALKENHPDLRVPGQLAIAHHLIHSWVSGEVTL